jgi:hypothetical protein
MSAYTPRLLASVAETFFTMPFAIAWMEMFTPGFISRSLWKLE